jgi:N-acetyl-gamma-glutamyl-phosphate reductase
VEAHRHELAGATLVAAPGCNATAVNLALLPLAEAGLLSGRTAVCHVVTGSSGGGRSLGELHHFPELNESVMAYKAAGTHRHTAEVEAVLSRAARQGRHATTQGERDERVQVTFTPHLAPLTRGIHASCVVPVEGQLDGAALDALYRERYDTEPLVQFGAELPRTKSVAGTDFVHVAVRHDPRTGTAHAFATIDNLGKGAAGQAVQGFNVAFGFEETTGLQLNGIWP